MLLVWPVVAAAFDPQPEPPARFGMIGIVYGQTARLNVATLSHPPDAISPACNLILGFVDATGRAFMQRDGSEVVLMPGHAAFLELDPGDLRDFRGRRVDLRAGVKKVGAHPFRSARGQALNRRSIQDLPRSRKS